MKVIFGLGNIGERYTSTRHNVGFRFIDYILGKTGGSETGQEKHGGIVVRREIKGETILFIKPTTLMNLSGNCVRDVVNFYKVPVENILVVHDDLDIPLGGCKMQVSKGPKGHNGLIDIEKKLGTNDFLRLRLGIENRRDPRFAGEDYVLGKFSKEETEVIRETIVSAGDMVLNSFIKGEETERRRN